MDAHFILHVFITHFLEHFFSFIFIISLSVCLFDLVTSVLLLPHLI